MIVLAIVLVTCCHPNTDYRSNNGWSSNWLLSHTRHWISTCRYIYANFLSSRVPRVQAASTFIRQNFLEKTCHHAFPCAVPVLWKTLPYQLRTATFNFTCSPLQTLITAEPGSQCLCNQVIWMRHINLYIIILLLKMRLRHQRALNLT